MLLRSDGEAISWGSNEYLQSFLPERGTPDALGRSLAASAHRPHAA